MARVTEIPVRIGDTLPSLAQRVLGDGLRWRELVTLNHLKPPFLVSSLDPLDRLPDTVLWGDWIKVPAQAINASVVTGEEALGQDVRLDKGRLTTTNGDLNLILGGANFSQALRHRVTVPYGSFLPHPTYGCEIYSILGVGNNAVVMLLGSGFVRRALLRDPRSATINVGARAAGDTLAIDVQAQAVGEERVMDLNLLYQLPVI